MQHRQTMRLVRRVRRTALSAHRFTMHPGMTELARHIANEIQRNGAIPFAQFMQLALYDSRHGYYSGVSQRQIGRHGDFFTSVSVGPFFGELLAFQFTQWIHDLARQQPRDASGQVFQIVEAGAHDGQLAWDVLEAIQRTEPVFFSTLQYWIVEPFAARRANQETKLRQFGNVRWFASVTDMPARVDGVFFSNELLDAMPVHVFRWSVAAQVWMEMGVAWRENQFVWEPLPAPTINPPQLPDELLALLPDGYVVECSPAAVRWWREAAGALSHGKLMTIDYGGTLEELLSPGRSSGTLRAYARHRVGSDVLEKPGEQDITAHVNFSEIRHAGEVVGLKTEAFTTQSQFLTTIAREMWTRTGSWPQHQVRQFQTLTHPEHLGRPFRVLVQSR